MKEEPIKSEALAGKTTRNAAWNVGGFLFSLAITLITIPIFISLLGDNNYGLFVLFQSIMAGFNLMGLGVGPATVKYVAESIGRENYEDANQFINTTLCFNLLIGIIGAILIALLAGPMAQKVFKIPVECQMIAQKCFYWVAVGWFISQIAGTLSGIPMAFQNFKIAAIGSALSSGLIAILGLAVLYVGGNLVNLIQANAAAIAISTIGWYFFARIVFPELKIRIGIDWKLFKKTISYGSWQTLAGLGGMMYHWMDRVIIGIFLPPAAIGYYNVPVAVCSRAHTGLAQIGTVFFPLISYLQGKNDKERIYKYFINGSWVIGLFSAVGYVPLALFGKSCLGFWISPEFAEKSSQLFIIIILAHMVLSTSVIRYNFLAGIGKPSWIVLGALLSGSIGLLSMVVLIPQFGLMGAGWSYFASALSGIVITILIKIRYFPEKGWPKILYGIYGPIIIGFMIILATYNIMSVLTVHSWINLVFYLGIAVLSTSALLMIIDFILFGSEKRGKSVWNVVQDSIRFR